MKKGKLSKLRREALLVTVVASVLSIYTTTSFIFAMGYSGSMEDLAAENISQITSTDLSTEPVIKSKAKLDDTGIVVNTLQLSKTGVEATSNMEDQLEIAKEAKEETNLVIRKFKEQENAKIEAELAKAREERSKRIEIDSLVNYSVSPYYDDENKLIISDGKQAKSLDIRTPCNWEYEDFEIAVKPSLHELIPVVMRLEEETGVNALYLIASAAAETGWGTQLAGTYNYFNWSTDGKYYYDFASMDDFAEYSSNRYGERYTDPDFYVAFIDGNTKPDVITPSVVNFAYAKYQDGSINWKWSKEICDIMAGISRGRVEGRCIYLPDAEQVVA